MPCAIAGMAVHGGAIGCVPFTIPVSASNSRSDWSPTLNGLHSEYGRENGPAGVSLIPSGKNGRERKPFARSLKATEPSSRRPSDRAFETYSPNFAAERAAPPPRRREEGGRPRLLRRDIEAEDRRVGGPGDPEHLATGVHDGDVDLSEASEGSPDPDGCVAPGDAPEGWPDRGARLVRLRKALSNDVPRLPRR